MTRQRRSAKQVIEDYARELLDRTTDSEAPIKLLTIETIALRMGWNDLYDKLRFRSRNVQIKTETETLEDRRQPWWTRD